MFQKTQSWPSTVGARGILIYRHRRPLGFLPSVVAPSPSLLRTRSSHLRRQKQRQRDGEGTHGSAREALCPGNHPWIQEVQVEPVREHLAGSDRGREHQGRRRLVRGEAHGVHLQGQDQEQRHALPLHLGQGQPPSRQLRSRPRQVQVQPAAGIHGSQGQGLHVPQQHLKIISRCGGGLCLFELNYILVISELRTRVSEPNCFLENPLRSSP